jgi:hypothetical protein
VAGAPGPRRRPGTFRTAVKDPDHYPSWEVVAYRATLMDVYIYASRVRGFLAATLYYTSMGSPSYRKDVHKSGPQVFPRGISQDSWAAVEPV